MITNWCNIVERIKQGEKHAFRLLYDAYAPLVYDLAFKLLKDRATAEEMVQDCFIRIWNGRDKMDEKHEVWPLIYVTAKRLCFNELRNARVAQKYLNQVENILVNDVQQHIEVRELENRLEQSIEKLPEQQKRALRLSRMEGYSHQQIAVEMGISQNTVKNHITQALKNLRKVLLQADYHYLIVFYLLIDTACRA